MIKLIISNIPPHKNKKIMKMSDIERLQYDATFSIWIDNKLFFHVDDFIIFDFLYHFNLWRIQESTLNFYYNCIETEDNPLISLVKKNDLWYLSSTWQNFEWHQPININTFISEIDNLVSTNNLRM